MAGRVEVTFETGLLADFLRQAASVAPTSGKDVTTYAGIVMEIDPIEKMTRIKSTDSMTFYNSWMPCEVNVIAGEAEAMTWRLPSNAFSSIVGSLPGGSGRTVTFFQEGRQLSMKSGKTQARFNLITPDGYPTWEPFDDEIKMVQVPGLREAMKRIEWCVAKGNDAMAPITGLLVGPDLVAATDKIRFAAVQIDTPFERDLSVPLAIPRIVMSGKVEPEVAVSANGYNWLARIDEDTQYSTVLYDKAWPDVRKIFSRSGDQTDSIQFDKDVFLDMAKRALQMSTAKRTAKLDVFIGDESLAVFCSDTEMGFLGDQVELPGQAKHSIVKIRFMPETILDLIQSGDDSIVMHYASGHGYVDVDPSTVPKGYSRKSQLRFELGKNYQAWAMPLTGRAITK